MSIDYTVIIGILLNILVYLIGFYLVWRNGGVTKNLALWFSLVIFVVYYFITPVYFYYIGRTTIWGDLYPGVGVNIIDYYGISLIYYGIANFCFILGYFCFRYKKKSIKIDIKIFTRENTRGPIILAFVVCYLIVLINFISSGFNPLDFLLGDTESSLWNADTNSYFRNFADSLIAINIIAFYFNLEKKYFLPMTLLNFILFLLMGFRYRLILVIIGFFFSFLLTKKKFSINYWKMGSSILLFCYFMFFITYNRAVFSKGEVDKFTANPIEFDYSLFFDQTRGMLDDINIIQYYDTNPRARHDNGISFLYFIIRAIPRSLVGDKFKDSFYPFPAQVIILDAYDLSWAWGVTSPGEAPLHLAYFVIAGGIYFLFIGSFLVGIILRFLTSRLDLSSDKNKLITIIFACSFFQWYTRGFFPGFVDHLAFLLIGVYIVFFLTKVFAFQVRSGNISKKITS